MERGVKRGREREVCKITFWHVAGLKNKDREFLERLKELDVIFLSET